MLIDTHCHLDFTQFDSERDEVLSRCRKAGVDIVINPGFDLPSSRRAVALAERYPQVYAAVGVHPHQAKTITDGVMAELRDLAAHPRVVAIGEIGLDFYRDLSPRDVQRDVFRRQLALARDLDLPVIVHSRAAEAEIVSLLERERRPADGPASDSVSDWPKGVLHAFSGDLEVATSVVAMGMYVGVAGPVTFGNAHALHEMVRTVPLHAMLLETDAPYLTPHPHRGERNEPAYVALVAAAIAELRSIAETKVREKTTHSAQQLFGLM